jgi:hypothetical protein
MKTRIGKFERTILWLLGILMILTSVSIYLCLNKENVIWPYFLIIDWLAIAADLGAFSFVLMQNERRWTAYFTAFFVISLIIILSRFGWLEAVIGLILFSMFGFIVVVKTGLPEEEPVDDTDNLLDTEKSNRIVLSKPGPVEPVKMEIIRNQEN